MSNEKKPQSPPSNLPKQKVDDAAAAKVKGGAEPISSRPKPAEPVNGIRTK